MNIKFDNKEYRFDLEDITVEHARVIKKYCGMTLKALEEGLPEGDPDAMTCLYWLMLKQSGEDHNIEKVTFKLLKFAKAFAEGSQEAAKLEPPKEDDVTA